MIKDRVSMVVMIARHVGVEMTVDVASSIVDRINKMSWGVVLNQHDDQGTKMTDQSTQSITR